MPTALFCTPHYLLDTASGAAVSALETLRLLRDSGGWRTSLLCGPKTDGAPPQEGFAAHVAAVAGGEVDASYCEAGPAPFRLLHANGTFGRGRVYVPSATADEAASASWIDTPDGGYPFLAVLDRLLDREPPDLLLTYGGGWLGRAIVAAGYRRAVPTVFWLRNTAYTQADLFEHCDLTIVPGPFVRELYRHRMGLVPDAIPAPVSLDRVRCERVTPQYMTFINPTPAKGLAVFAGLVAETLRRDRADIRFLVVEGRRGRDELARWGIADAPNVEVMANTPDPRRFYGVSRTVLVPSLWDEPYARVPVEAFANGIPVVGSRRGGLVDNFAEAGIGLDLPGHLTPDWTERATPADVSEWYEVLCRLWDDESARAAEGRRGLQAAESIHPSRLLPRYLAAFDRAARRAARKPRVKLRDVLQSARLLLSPAGSAKAGDLTPIVLDQLLDTARER